MKIIHFTIFLVFSLLLAISCQNSKNTIEEEVVNRWIQTTIDSAVSENQVKFLSVAVNSNRHQPQFDQYGMAHSDSIRYMDENTTFPINNLSKIVTGIIVNNLISEKKLDLEEPVSTYIGDLLNDSAKVSFSNIWFKHLLYHRSGITDGDCSYFNKVNFIGEEGYTQDLFFEDLNRIDLNPEDYRFEYSNFGYAIIGLICQQVSGKSFDALLEEYVIDKYGLSNTGIITNTNKSIPAKFTQGNTDGDLSSFIMPPLPFAPAIGIYSNLTDLSKLQSEQIQSYQNYFERGMMEPLVLTAFSERTKFDRWKYGSGFMIITNEDSKYFGYYHPSEGFGSMYLFSTYPDRGVTLFASEDGLWLRDLGLTLLDGLTDQKYMVQPMIRPLAWTLYSVVDAEGIMTGLEWYEQNRNNRKYRLIESDMNTIGYRLLREGKTKSAIEVFKLNVKEFPESSNVYDSLGEAYLDDGNEELAIENYQKSLDMDPGNSRAKRVLNRLREEPVE